MKILDCTLRDGGYNNQWLFGRENILYIVEKLALSNVDIIELGYFDLNTDLNEDKTIFKSDLQLIEFEKRFDKVEFALMVDHRKGLIPELVSFPRNFILRYAFHKEDENEALLNISYLVKAGYKVYVQPMVTNNYTREELIRMIVDINKIKPASLYIVDSFGSLNTLELNNIIDIFKSFLDNTINIGFHAHDNRGLSMANGKLFMKELITSDYEFVIDSSVNGMGRGAGNLKTEFILDEEYSHGKKYFIEPIFDLIDNYFNVHHLKRTWGYTLNKQLSGRLNIHPNYAIFLEDIGLLTHSQVDSLLRKIVFSKRIKYDEEYVARLYKDEISSNAKKLKLPNFKNKEVILIAPGNSSLKFDFDTTDLLLTKNIILSINHRPDNLVPNYIFITKIKRYSSLINKSKSKIIVTDDIDLDESKLIVSRNQLMNNYYGVEDNAGLMAISLAIISGASKISLIGFDGYNKNARNVIDSIIDVTLSSRKIEKINSGMIKAIVSYSKIIPINFLTKSLYDTKLD